MDEYFDERQQKKQQKFLDAIKTGNEKQVKKYLDENSDS